MSKRLILCDCMGSMSLDPEQLGAASGLGCSRVHTALCSKELGAAAKAIEAGDALIACTQEAQRFEELATEMGQHVPSFVDLRDRAGWGEGSQTAKMAALLWDATRPAPAVKTLDVESHGQCLVIGAGAVAIPMAEQLSATLAVTVLVTDAVDLPTDRTFEVIQGRIVSVTGALGGFTLRIDALRQVVPGGRGALTLSDARDGAQTVCDLIVDLTGDTPLVPAPNKRDGYFRADPKDPRQVAALAVEAAQAVGVFEKPLHVAVESTLCAHSRASQSGCSRCLDACPTGAIVPDGEHVTVDPMICAGCGACSSLCPSGAISYDAPPVADTLVRVAGLAKAYADVAGTPPRLLVHDDHGAEMIALAARFGRGLPADVIPLHIAGLAAFGHAEILSARATGMSAVHMVLSPQADADVVARECNLAQALGATAVTIIDTPDPDAMVEALYAAEPSGPVTAPILPMGSRRQVARMAAKALGGEGVLPLPAGAPYGAVAVRTDACTLCLSCVSLCPSGALVDNPDKPQLQFQEDACLQCGICASACPEKAIELVPQLDLANDALSARTLKEEEPACCVECGAAFGVKSTIDRIMSKLADQHPMFMGSERARMIQMCDDCRVNAQYHAQNNPMTGATRPRPVTTDDYFGKRRDH